MIGLVVVMLVLLAVVTFIGAPIYQDAADGRRGDKADVQSSDLDQLEAERDAKLREIRDAELDWRTGKLSEADWQQLDAELRSDAAAILHRVEAEGVKKPSEQ
ncbi:MAG: hypothetical protein F2799_00740 [Actinobacteria bacterium]|uniref:Unannotated protein n=1 Tax=freshwater metagenome TaxID=449393 RepID=A0A6J7CUX8_9ZZZZ|nr:hypothetical protein [Actinomycetota bacterium]